MKQIPNAITCLNLISGCIACTMALNGLYQYALLWVIIAAVLDFCDGFAARLLKAYSNIGKELDSLADVVSFGVAPGMVIFSYLNSQASHIVILPYLAFIIPAFAALRLAKFNLDERQTSSFLGFPTPANALFWCSFIPFLASSNLGNEIIQTVIILSLTILCCLFMISEIPMFSLKFKNYRWKGNEAQYILVILAVASLCLFNYAGICITIVLYMLISIILNIIRKKQS